MSYQAGDAYIGHVNLAGRTDSLISATSAEIGFPAANLKDWSAATQWRATGVTLQTVVVQLAALTQIDSWGVYKHNFGEPADVPGNTSIDAEWSLDGAVWNTFGTSLLIEEGDDSAIFEIITVPVSALYFRLQILAREPAIVANLFVGDALRLYAPPETPFTPPAQSNQDRVINSVSDGGDFLGRSLVSKGGRTGFQISAVPASWVDANWVPFMNSARSHPFYFAWDSAAHPRDVAYCFTDRPLASPLYSGAMVETLRASFIAL